MKNTIFHCFLCFQVVNPKLQELAQGSRFGGRGGGGRYGGGGRSGGGGGRYGGGGGGGRRW